MLKGLVKKCYLLLAFFIISFALMSSALRLATPWLANYRLSISQLVSDSMGAPVTIGELQAGWYWFQPVIRLQQLSIHQKHLANHLTISQLMVGIDLWQSLKQWRFQPGKMVLEGVALEVDLSSLVNHPAVNVKKGVTVPSHNAANLLLDWLFKQHYVLIKNGEVHLQLADKKTVHLHLRELKLVNDSLGHHVKARMTMGAMSKTIINVVGNIQGQRLEALSGSIYTHVKQLALSSPLISALTDLGIQAKGWVNAKSWWSLTKGQLAKLQVKLTASNVSLKHFGARRSLDLDKLSAHLLYEPTVSGALLSADNVGLVIDGQTVQGVQLKLEQDTASSRFFVSYLPLTLVPAIAAQLPLSPDISLPAVFYQDALYGSLKQVALQIEGNKLTSLSFQGEKVGIHPSDNYPGVDGLSMNFAGNLQKARLQIDSARLQLSFPAQWSQPLTLKRVSAQMNATKTKDQWQLAFDKVHLVSERLNLHSSFNVALKPILKDSDIQIFSQFLCTDLEKFKGYIPKSLRGKKLFQWFDKALVKVPSVNGSLRIEGPLSAIPFTDSAGVFDLKLNIHGTTIDYNPKWPAVSQIAATVSVDSHQLNAKVHQAETAGVKLANVSLAIKSLWNERPVLTINGLVTDKTKRALEFVSITPLAKKLARLHQLDFSGRMKLLLALTIPLYQHAPELTVKGVLQFLNNKLRLPKPWPLTLNALNGPLKFSQSGIQQSQLTARVLSQPVVLAIQSNPTEPSVTDVSLKGHVSVSDLLQQYQRPIASFISGDTDVQLDLKLQQKSADSLILKSSLKGLAIKAPAPLGKAATTEQTLILKTTLSTTPLMSVEGLFGDLLQAKVWVNKARYQLQKGWLTVGKVTAPKAPQKGFSIHGQLAYLSMDEWQSFIRQLAPIQSDASLADRSISLALDVERLHLGPLVFKQQTINLLPEATAWRLALHGPDMKGAVVIPVKKNQPLRLRLAHLALNVDDTRVVSNATQLATDSLPPLSAEIMALSYQQRPLGYLSLHTAVKKGHLQIVDLKLMGEFFELRLNGDWLSLHQQSRSQITGSLTASNIGKALRRLGIESMLESNQGELTFDGYWHAGLFSPQLSEVVGKMSFNFKQGRITHLSKATEDKIGLGKLLSILSLQTLPRRLSLDFSDLSNKGYSFDSLKGDVTLSRAVLTTTNTLADGPVASTAIRGSINLINKDLDLLLQVFPHVTASLPVVATIAGGPIAGVAAWVATKIINQEMHRGSDHRYQITGPWSNPLITPLSKHPPRTAKSPRRT